MPHRRGSDADGAAPPDATATEVARLRALAAAGDLDGVTRVAASLVTERDEARAGAAFLAEHTTDAVFRMQLEPEVRVEHLSLSLESLTGRSLEELSAGPEVYRAHVHPEDLPALDVLDAPDAHAGPRLRTPPYRLLHRDGSIRWVETLAWVRRGADGSVQEISGTTREMSVSWRREEALRTALDRERTATEELRRVARLKDALLSAVSHELRTPLTVLQGFAELLLARGEDLHPSNRDAAIVAVERNARRLDDLLGSILDLDRLGRDAVILLPREFAYAELVQDAIDALGIAGGEVSVDLAGIRVTADRAKLERVVENLLANAVKHGSVREPVQVRGWYADDGVVLEVADSGPGLPAELREAVFEPFERGAADSATPGTGLGLALVRGFVELHDGRVWVEDHRGGGASFRVWLPQPPDAR